MWEATTAGSPEEAAPRPSAARRRQKQPEPSEARSMETVMTKLSAPPTIINATMPPNDTLGSCASGPAEHAIATPRASPTGTSSTDSTSRASISAGTMVKNSSATQATAMSDDTILRIELLTALWGF